MRGKSNRPPVLRRKPARWLVRLLMVLPVSVVMAASVIAPVSTASAAESAAGYYEYDYTYQISPGVIDVAAVREMATQNFDRYFPFMGCSGPLYVGQRCDLQFGTLTVGTSPIQVTRITETSFQFVSLPGHVEGPNRLIDFIFYDSDGKTWLNVWSRGPATIPAQATGFFGIANRLWQTYADALAHGISVGDHIPFLPPPPPPPSSGTKFWVDTFASAPGYSSPGSGPQTGTLWAGTNYVFCKIWGPVVQVGSDYNHWWMRTDLDTGSPWQDQYVSAYYLSHWGNDQAKDNSGQDLPDC